jgi:uncharacterized membrane protein YkvA (DUF1232 family)
MKHQQLIRAFRFECSLLDVVWRSRNCFSSRVSLAIGLGYWVDPWQLIPDRVPIFGYSDQLIVTLASLAVARLLIPPRLEHRIARQLAVYGGNESRLTCSLTHIATVRSWLVTRWLVFKRRVLLLVERTVGFARKMHLRWTTAIERGKPAEMLFILLGYRVWWLLRGSFVACPSKCRSIVVIGGAARSGTTLLRTLLGRHPMIAGGPETTVFLYRISSPVDIGERLGWEPSLIEGWQRESHSQVEFIERFRSAILERSGKVVWVEKTPKNIGRFGFVRRCFPHAKLVHIIRDGRDVVCSLRLTPFAKLDHAPWQSVEAARRCAVQWQSSVRAGVHFRSDPAYYELRYEDLVHNPEATLRALTDVLGVPWDDGMLAPTFEANGDALARGRHEAITPANEIFETSVGRWRHELSHYDCNTLRLLIGPLLVELGYEDKLDWGAGASQAESADRRYDVSSTREVNPLPGPSGG